MIHLRILTSGAEAQYADAVSHPQRIEEYRSAPSFTIHHEQDTLLTRIELRDGFPKLVDSTSSGRRPAATDAENAQLIHSALRVLKPAYATDRRLWATLTHDTYWEYTRWRYSSIKSGQAATSYIRSHWFVSGSGLGSLRRNAIARLWWAGHLTVAPWEVDSALQRFEHADRYKYTNVLLSSQQVYQDVMERDFGSNLRLRICLLDAFDRHRPAVSSADELIKKAASRLNLILEYKHLLTLPVDEMHGACVSVMAEASASLQRDPPPDRPDEAEEE